MALQYQIFTVPCSELEASVESLNSFLRTVRAVQIQRETFMRNDILHVTFIVEYLSGVKNAESSEAKKIDYKNELNDDDFAVFSELRNLRKNLAEEKKVQLYTIATNEQLAQMARMRPKNKAELGNIDGFGQGRMKDYADRILNWFLQKNISTPV
jgi:superfamily II DNA helicase RecQ